MLLLLLKEVSNTNSFTILAVRTALQVQGKQQSFVPMHIFGFSISTRYTVALLMLFVCVYLYNNIA